MLISAVEISTVQHYVMFEEKSSYASGFETFFFGVSGSYGAFFLRKIVKTPIFYYAVSVSTNDISGGKYTLFRYTHFWGDILCSRC